MPTLGADAFGLVAFFRMAAVVDRPPATPHALDAERSLLGAVMFDGERMIDIAPLVTANDFYDPLHRAIYAAVERLHENRSPIDPVTVADVLRSHESFQATGGVAFLATLAANVPSSSHAVRYAEILREMSLRRRIAALGDTLTALAHDTAQEGSELLEHAEQQLVALT